MKTNDFPSHVNITDESIDPDNVSLLPFVAPLTNAPVDPVRTLANAVRLRKTKSAPGTDAAAGIVCVIAAEPDNVYIPPAVRTVDEVIALTTIVIPAITILSEPDSALRPKIGDIVIFMFAFYK